MTNKPVYSTSKSSTGADKSPGGERGGRQLSTGPLKMRLETKGRAGKAVTVLFNLPMTEDGAKVLMRELQEKLGCGATFKDASIELRGDMRDRIEAQLTTKGIKVVRAGG